MTTEILYSQKNWSPTSRAIRAGTDSPWSHVDIVIPAWVEFQAGTLVGSQRVIGAVAWQGVTVRNISEVFDHSTTVGIGEIEVPNEAKAWKWAFEQVGKGYDWLGVFGIGVRIRGWERPDRFFCSEFKLGFVEAGGLYIFGDDNSRFTPRDGWTNPFLRRRRICTVKNGKITSEVWIPDSLHP